MVEFYQNDLIQKRYFKHLITTSERPIIPIYFDSESVILSYIGISVEFRIPLQLITNNPGFPKQEMVF